MSHNRAAVLALLIATFITYGAVRYDRPEAILGYFLVVLLLQWYLDRKDRR